MKFGKYFGPMLLDEIPESFDDKDYIFELKFDGFRATIHTGPKLFKIYSRNGMDITHIYPELKGIQRLVKKNTIIDGEIVSFKDGVPNFSSLQTRSHLKNKKKIELESIENPVCFIAFDCLYVDKDITSKQLLERKKVLEKIPDNDVFIKTTYIEEYGKRLFKKVKKMNLEGIVAKKKNSIYTPDFRTKDWIKIKNLKTDTFIVGAYSLNEVNASLYLGEYKGKTFKYVGKVSIAKNKKFFKNVLKLPKKNKSPFSDKSIKGTIYVSPKLSCEIKYLEKTPNGSLRQPVFSKEIE